VSLASVSELLRLRPVLQLTIIDKVTNWIHHPAMDERKNEDASLLSIVVSWPVR